MNVNENVQVSVVAPAKEEENTIRGVYEGVRQALEGSGKSFELIFVDDGSKDHTFQEMKDLAGEDSRVHAVRFLKNFGKSAALAAGFERSRGEYVITLDSDLQDDPSEIPRFIEALEAGAHLVSGWKKGRRDPFTRRLASRVFNAVTRLMSGVKVHDINCGFKGYRKEVVSSLVLYGELHRFIPALASARGFSVSEIEVKHHPRKYGRSRYGLERMPRGFFDLLTVLFLTQYARRPLHLFGGAGALLGLLGFAALLYLTAIWFMGIRPIGTRPLFMGGILLLLLGAQLFSLGLIGELIANITHRPGEQYVVTEEL